MPIPLKAERKKAKESRLGMCPECRVRFVWERSKDGLCYWCEQSNSKPNRRRRKSSDR